MPRGCTCRASPTVIEEASVADKRYGVDRAVDLYRRERAGEEAGALGLRKAPVEGRQPAGAGELGRPDDVGKKDIERWVVAAQLVRQEVVQLIGVIRPHFPLDPDTRMRGMEALKQLVPELG